MRTLRESVETGEHSTRKCCLSRAVEGMLIWLQLNSLLLGGIRRCPIWLTPEGFMVRFEGRDSGYRGGWTHVEVEGEFGNQCTCMPPSRGIRRCYFNVWEGSSDRHSSLAEGEDQLVARWILARQQPINSTADVDFSPRNQCWMPIRSRVELEPSHRRCYRSSASEFGDRDRGWITSCEKSVPGAER